MATYTVWDTAASTAAINEALVKESVEPQIYDLFPEDFALSRRLKRVSMMSTFHEVPIKSLAARVTRASSVVTPAATFPAAANNGAARKEGDVFTTNTPQYPRKLKSVSQIGGEAFAVSKTDRAMSHHAIGDRFTAETIEILRKTANDRELHFWWSPGTKPQGDELDTSGGGHVARQTQGLMHWILKTGLQRSGAGGAAGLATSGDFLDGHENNFGDNNPVLNNTMTYAYHANGLPLDRTMLNTVLSEYWNMCNAGENLLGFVSTKVRPLFVSFALPNGQLVNERNVDASGFTTYDRVDVYKTDNFTIQLVNSRYLSRPGQTSTIVVDTGGSTANVTVPWDECLVLINPEYYAIGEVRPLGFTPVAQQLIDADQGIVSYESGMICYNPQGGTAIVDCV